MNALGRILWITLLALVAVGSSHAAEIWLDADGDGLPDSDTLAVQVGGSVTVGIWIDSDSYAWTNFLAYVEFTEGLEVDSAKYSVTEGGSFPIDDFSVPNGIGLGGSGYSESGVTKLGEVHAHATASGLVCFTPLTNEEGVVFSQLGADTTYALFATGWQACLAVASGGSEQTITGVFPETLSVYGGPYPFRLRGDSLRAVTALELSAGDSAYTVLLESTIEYPDSLVGLGVVPDLEPGTYSVAAITATGSCSAPQLDETLFEA